MTVAVAGSLDVTQSHWDAHMLIMQRHFISTDINICSQGKNKLLSDICLVADRLFKGLSAATHTYTHAHACVCV